jgi:hypothetical protein
MKVFFTLALLSIILPACTDINALAEKSFGKLDNKNSKADPANVISMGRDDDDGKAKKWHIGGTKD